MAIDNYSIADQFSMLAKLMDIHGENSFKAKSYSNAAFNIEKLPAPLATTPREKIAGIKGIGESAAKKIVELLETGHLKVLDELLERTPPGVIELMQIKGLGPKKIATIWHEMGIESVGELLYACNENRLLLYKGFGEKTQQNVQESIQFYFKHLGSYLYRDIEPYAQQVTATLQKSFGEDLVEITGDFRQQRTIIRQLEFITTKDIPALEAFFTAQNFDIENKTADSIAFKGVEEVVLVFYCSTRESFYQRLLQTSSSPEFYDAISSQQNWIDNGAVTSEAALFSAVGTHFIPAYLREKPAIIEQARQQDFSNVIQVSEIKGIVHNHSNWSDGLNTIEEMAHACIDQGFEYLVISDHSKTATYAKGLPVDRIREQHLYIDELNAKLAPFKIFKSIESDILNDGALDYNNEVLATFDLVIASVHANLNMPQEKAMMRLLNAIQNPYTTILGHMTGRLLLSRNGYPIDHAAIINACVDNHVVIELNAHPRRLDMDWWWIDYAVEQGALISINPDAHNTEGFADIRYGVLAAQKAGLTRENNLSSFSLPAFEQFLNIRRQLKNI